MRLVLSCIICTFPFLLLVEGPSRIGNFTRRMVRVTLLLSTLGLRWFGIMGMLVVTVAIPVWTPLFTVLTVVMGGLTKATFVRL